jgi:ribosomal protein S18 acetylase RimI-like enzyme
LFARAILASYEQTMDCPGLLGLREVDDIIAGHMATGRFDPSLWYAFYQGDVPVGVMLLGILPPHRSGELIYLGIAPAYRGKGLARPILEHGLGELSARDTTRLLLAVDEANQPAIRLYRHLKFRTSARKAALIRAL